MGTLHTNSAPESIDRIVDVFPEAQQEQIRVQLANNLVAVVTQQILPRMAGDGRVIAFEVMIATPAVRALIREGKTYQLMSTIQTSANVGMSTMDNCLADLVKRKLVSYETGLSRAVDAKEYARIVAQQSEAAAAPAGNRPAAAAAPAAPVAGGANFGRR
jgi:twitching motility protein PilT